MGTISFREKVMLSCMFVLLFFLASIFIRLGTRFVLVEQLHWDNGITRFVLFDRPDMQLSGSIGNRERRQISVDWNGQYPFPDGDKSRLKERLDKYKAKTQELKEEHIEPWAQKHLIRYFDFVELGRSIENGIGWNIVNPAMNVYKFSDGYLTFAEKRQEQTEKIDSIADFADFVKAKGSQFLYVQSPGKTNPFADAEIKKICHTDENTEEVLQGLRARNVEVYDLREELHEAVGNAGWHSAFFRTDHHWKPETALWAAGKVAEKLKNSYGVDVNMTHFSSDDYEVQTYEKCFLGSQGKKLTLAYTEPDDFSLCYPKFPVKLHLQIADLGIDDTGDFTLLYDKRDWGSGNCYVDNPYAMYGYGDVLELIVHNYANESLSGKKILLIRDSMLDTGGPFLAMGLKDLRELDIRHFTGSVRKYVEQYQPDIVLIMYEANYEDPVDWTSHKDKFDFR